jgi:hypothetical protein
MTTMTNDTTKGPVGAEIYLCEGEIEVTWGAGVGAPYTAACGFDRSPLSYCRSCVINEARRQIADLTRERDAAREALKLWLDQYNVCKDCGGTKAGMYHVLEDRDAICPCSCHVGYMTLRDDSKAALREPTDTAEGGTP